MCSSGIVHSVEWQFLTDVSGNLVGPYRLSLRNCHSTLRRPHSNHEGSLKLRKLIALRMFSLSLNIKVFWDVTVSNSPLDREEEGATISRNVGNISTSDSVTLQKTCLCSTAAVSTSDKISQSLFYYYTAS